MVEKDWHLQALNCSFARIFQTFRYNDTEKSRYKIKVLLDTTSCEFHMLENRSSLYSELAV